MDRETHKRLAGNLLLAVSSAFLIVLMLGGLAFLALMLAMGD